MVQKPRVAPESDVRSLGERRRKAPSGSALAALRTVVSLALVAALAYAALRLSGPGAFHEHTRGLVAFASAAGEWARAALAAAFRSIPVR